MPNFFIQKSHILIPINMFEIFRFHALADQFYQLIFLRVWSILKPEKNRITSFKFNTPSKLLSNEYKKHLKKREYKWDKFTGDQLFWRFKVKSWSPQRDLWLWVWDTISYPTKSNSAHHPGKRLDWSVAGWNRKNRSIRYRSLIKDWPRIRTSPSYNFSTNKRTLIGHSSSYQKFEAIH